MVNSQIPQVLNQTNSVIHKSIKKYRFGYWIFELNKIIVNCIIKRNKVG